MPRPLLLAALAAALPVAAAAEPLVLTLGKGESGTAELVFDSAMSADDAFALRTTRVGAPGSALTLRVDSLPYPLVSQTLATSDCSFATGEAVCEVRIAGGTRAYADLVDAFRAGLTAHLDVQTGGHTAMRSSASLKGFTRAFAAL